MLKKVSVPSRGLSYLNLFVFEFNFKLFRFRPLTGTLLSKLIKTSKKKRRAKSFRPLTGTLLSKHHTPILPPQAAFFAGLRGK